MPSAYLTFDLPGIGKSKHGTIQCARRPWSSGDAEAQSRLQKGGPPSRPGYPGLGSRGKVWKTQPCTRRCNAPATPEKEPPSVGKGRWVLGAGVRTDRMLIRDPTAGQSCEVSTLAMNRTTAKRNGEAPNRSPQAPSTKHALPHHPPTHGMTLCNCCQDGSS